MCVEILHKAHKKTRYITQAAMIAAIYTIITYACAVFSQGLFQFRLQDAMMVLPYFTPAAIPGLFLGYLIGYFLLGNIWDAVFCSLAALVAATATYLIGRYLRRFRFSRFLASLPSIVIMSIVIPFVQMFIYESEEVYWLMLGMTVLGQLASVGILGQLFFSFVRRYEQYLF